MSCKKCDPEGKRNKPGEVILICHSYGKGHGISSVGKNITCVHCGQKYHVHQPTPIK